MDTNKMPAEMEAQFDAAFRAKFGCGIAEVAAAQHEDSMALMGAAMWAWQASREAVVVELPPRSARTTPAKAGLFVQRPSTTTKPLTTAARPSRPRA